MQWQGIGLSPLVRNQPPAVFRHFKTPLPPAYLKRLCWRPAAAHRFLCLYDAPAPPLLAAASKITTEFAAGLLLSGKPSAQDIAQIQITWAPAATTSRCLNPDLETLRLSNPAARVLPFAELIARQQTGSCMVPFNTHSLTLTLS